MSNQKDSWYAIRREDGKYLVIVKTPLGARVAIWIDNPELATAWPHMTGANLAAGLDLDPALHAERGGWDVVPVSRPQPTATTDEQTRVVKFSVAIPALLICWLSFAGVANAQSRFDWKPVIAVAAGQMADTLVTHHQINTPALHCSEANPLFGAHPSTAKLMLPKLAVIGGVSLVQIAARHAQSKAGRWVAKGAGYFAGALGGSLAAVNLRTCGW